MRNVFHDVCAHILGRDVCRKGWDKPSQSGIHAMGLLEQGCGIVWCERLVGQWLDLWSGQIVVGGVKNRLVRWIAAASLRESKVYSGGAVELLGLV